MWPFVPQIHVMKETMNVRLEKDQRRFVIMEADRQRTSSSSIIRQAIDLLAKEKSRTRKNQKPDAGYHENRPVNTHKPGQP